MSTAARWDAAAHAIRAAREIEALRQRAEPMTPVEFDRAVRDIDTKLSKSQRLLQPEKPVEFPSSQSVEGRPTTDQLDAALQRAQTSATQANHQLIDGKTDGENLLAVARVHLSRARDIAMALSRKEVG